MSEIDFDAISNLFAYCTAQVKWFGLGVEFPIFAIRFGAHRWPWLKLNSAKLHLPFS